MCSLCKTRDWVLNGWDNIPFSIRISHRKVKALDKAKHLPEVWLYWKGKCLFLSKIMPVWSGFYGRCFCFVVCFFFFFLAIPLLSQIISPQKLVRTVESGECNGIKPHPALCHTWDNIQFHSFPVVAKSILRAISPWWEFLGAVSPPFIFWEKALLIVN